MKIAFVFPGQGAQYAGMGCDVAEKFSVARAAFDEAAQTGDPVYVASISLVEVAYLVEKGKVTDEALEQLYQALADPDSGFVVVVNTHFGSFPILSEGCQSGT